MKKLILLLGLIVISCDPVVGYHKIIQNDSSYDIWLIPNEGSENALENISDSVLVASMTSFTIDSVINIGDGDPNDYSDCPIYPFPGDTLLTRIEGDSNLKLMEVIDANADWQFNIKEPGRNGLAECRLILTDADFQ